MKTKTEKEVSEFVNYGMLRQALEKTELSADAVQFIIDTIDDAVM